MYVYFSSPIHNYRIITRRITPHCCCFRVRCGCSSSCWSPPCSPFPTTSSCLSVGQRGRRGWMRLLGRGFRRWRWQGSTLSRISGRLHETCWCWAGRCCWEWSSQVGPASRLTQSHGIALRRACPWTWSYSGKWPLRFLTCPLGMRRSRGWIRGFQWKSKREAERSIQSCCR